MDKKYYVYILTYNNHNSLYTGVTSNLTRRIEQHKSLTADSYTKKYNITQLIYYEVYDDIKTAINREKQIKSWSRKRKEELINLHNPDWQELEI